MDASERPAPEPQDVTPRIDDQTARAAREAASRAAHPSRWQPRGSGRRRPSWASSTHFEEAGTRWLATENGPLRAWPQDEEARGVVLAAVGDLALLVGLRLRCDPAPLSPAYEVLVDSLVEVARRHDTRVLLGQDPRALVPLVAVQVALRAAGRTDLCLALAMEAAFAERSVPGLARTPDEAVELAHLLLQAHVALPCPPIHGLLAGSLLDPGADATLTREDVRAMARIILNASDFGDLAIPWSSAAAAVGVSLQLQRWLAQAVRAEDPELVGELLMALTCLGAAPRELTDRARRWLWGWQESDGRVEGYSSGLGHEADSPADWGAAVHATAVTVMDSLLLRTSAVTGARAAAAQVA
jgi:Domain of unknown function (DUF6895)